ncbi:hypothetical protein Syn7502_01505 [Synechococcus sp. PCC 7502]|uniref:hypothetical protein n=1 Tax=Synechococcus sp. PCC 7502 TaxID=1173263 RepID=UPI00029FCA6B|nr:hypothetical protein [Synechococcus sp. PCC 7502]AFY73573.1 hypothetical protein Syn7502_01505 [Synechococcus sp. PCC 7502]
MIRIHCIQLIRQSAYSYRALTVAVYCAFAQLTGAESVQHRHGNYIDFSQLKPTSILLSGTTALRGNPAVHFGLFVGCDRPPHFKHLDSRDRIRITPNSNLTCSIIKSLRSNAARHGRKIYCCYAFRNFGSLLRMGDFITGVPVEMIL